MPDRDWVEVLILYVLTGDMLIRRAGLDASVAIRVVDVGIVDCITLAVP